MPNQYTKAKEEGRELPKGANQFTTGKRERLDQATRDKLRAERAAQVLQDLMDDPSLSASERAAAAKALLPYGKSTYQSIESREEDPFENASNDDLREQVRALITLHPWLLDEFKPGPRDANAVQQMASDEVKTGSEG
jgi:hypothetical protein